MVTCRYPSQPHDTPPQHVSEPPQHAVSNWTGTLGLSVPENTAGTSSLMATTYSNPMADQSQFTNAPIDNTDQWLNELLAFATGQGTTDESSGIMNGTANAMFMPDTFDWGFGDVFDDTDIFQPMGTHAPPSPVAITGPESGSAISNISEKDEELVAAVQAEEVDGIAPARELPDGRPTTSPWVSGLLVEKGRLGAGRYQLLDVLSVMHHRRTVKAEHTGRTQLRRNHGSPRPASPIPISSDIILNTTTRRQGISATSNVYSQPTCAQ